VDKQRAQDIEWGGMDASPEMDARIANALQATVDQEADQYMSSEFDQKTINLARMAGCNLVRDHGTPYTMPDGQEILRLEVSVPVEFPGITQEGEEHNGRLAIKKRGRRRGKVDPDLFILLDESENPQLLHCMNMDQVKLEAGDDQPGPGVHVRDEDGRFILNYRPHFDAIRTIINDSEKQLHEQPTKLDKLTAWKNDTLAITEQHKNVLRRAGRVALVALAAGTVLFGAANVVSWLTTSDAERLAQQEAAAQVEADEAQRIADMLAENQQLVDEFDAQQLTITDQSGRICIGEDPTLPTPSFQLVQDPDLSFGKIPEIGQDRDRHENPNVVNGNPEIDIYEEGTNVPIDELREFNMNYYDSTEYANVQLGSQDDCIVAYIDADNPLRELLTVQLGEKTLRVSLGDSVDGISYDGPTRVVVTRVPADG